jgi:lipoate-protein ligase A
MPSRQPDYRQGRDHQSFMVNLAIPAAEIKAALCKTWLATEVLESPPDIAALIKERYSTARWNLKY